MSGKRSFVINSVKCFILFCIGGFSYYGIEIIWRGYSHWSMGIVGGLAFIAIGLINSYLKWETPLYLQCLIATTIVLVLEFTSGCVINLWLGWNVWNYSAMYGNLLGQICPIYAILWYPLTAIAIVLDDFIRWLLFKEPFKGYKLK